MRHQIAVEIPAIKMIDAGPLSAQTFAIGDLVLCVVDFFDVELEDRWGDFCPPPLAWATNDAKAIAPNPTQLESDGPVELRRWLRILGLGENEGEIVGCRTGP
jgi:hypothetical protein